MNIVEQIIKVIHIKNYIGFGNTQRKYLRSFNWYCGKFFRKHPVMKFSPTFSYYHTNILEISTYFLKYASKRWADWRYSLHEEQVWMFIWELTVSEAKSSEDNLEIFIQSHKYLIYFTMSLSDYLLSSVKKKIILPDGLSIILSNSNSRFWKSWDTII